MKKIMTFGTFDFLHDGHINIINKAIEFAGGQENVYIGVSSDKWNELKGKKSVESQEERYKNILERFPKVNLFFENHKDFEESWPKFFDEFNIDEILMGDDHSENLNYINENTTPNGRKMKIVFVPRTMNISSSNLRNVKNKVEIKTAVIPVAGMGTRFLPFTKTIPKEMLPILNKPTVQVIVEEAVDAGIEEIIFVISNSKEAIVNHFSEVEKLNEFLNSNRKEHMLDDINELVKRIKIKSVIQNEQLGLGHAVLQVKEHLVDKPFLLMLGDDVFFYGENENPSLELISKFKETGKTVIGTKVVADNEVSSYGIIEVDEFLNATNFFEKPDLNETSSRLAISGRYILTPIVFKFLSEMRIDKRTNEIQLTDSLKKIMKIEGAIVNEISANRFDMGSIDGFVKSQIFSFIESDMITFEQKKEMVSFVNKKWKDLQ